MGSGLGASVMSKEALARHSRDHRPASKASCLCCVCVLVLGYFASRPRPYGSGPAAKSLPRTYGLRKHEGMCTIAARVSGSYANKKPNMALSSWLIVRDLPSQQWPPRRWPLWPPCCHFGSKMPQGFTRQEKEFGIFCGPNMPLTSIESCTSGEHGHR